MKVKKESEQVVLKLNIQKTKIMASSPSDLLGREEADTREQLSWTELKLHYNLRPAGYSCLGNKKKILYFPWETGNNSFMYLLFILCNRVKRSPQ